jgi:hypothetical protein
METIELKFDDIDIPVETLDINDGVGSMGMEFLMNNKKPVGKTDSKISVNDLNTINDELNELSGVKTSAAPDSKIFGGLSDLFGSKPAVTTTSSDSNLGKGTKEETSGTQKTWDGFMKFGDVPDEKPVQTRLTEREKYRRKKMMINKLNEWKEKGIVSNQLHFSQDAPYEEIEDEYETALEDKKKKEAKKLYSWWFLTAVNTLEYANSALNPFDINLDGWGEAVSDDMDSYDEIFGKLYEKYKGGEMSPELSLVMRLGFSAATTCFANKALGSATPGFNDVIRQSPELMKAFTTATASAMSQQSPGFAFAQNLMNPTPSTQKPPPPMDPKADTAPMRPDLNMSRGLYKEPGIDIRNNQEQVHRMDRSPANPPSFSTHRVERPEMTGPRNIQVDNILSGLKTKTVDLNQKRDEDSIMSISSLGDINMPKSKRKGSSKNVVSLDL